MLFQSTPPHGERPIRNFPKGPAMIFQSTLPHGERPLISINHAVPRFISIHAPAWGATYRERRGIDYDLYFNPRSRMESDSTSRARPSWKSNFNPRSRMGSDEESESVESEEEVFQSTPPAWGATRHPPRGCSIKIISIHAPRMGSDRRFTSAASGESNFNPRSPHGERPFRLL